LKEEDGHAHADDDRSQGAERAKGHDASAESHGMSEARHEEQPAKPLNVGRGARQQLKERESDENEPGVLRQVAVASNGSVEGAIRISIAQVGLRSARCRPTRIIRRTFRITMAPVVAAAKWGINRVWSVMSAVSLAGGLALTAAQGSLECGAGPQGFVIGGDVSQVGEVYKACGQVHAIAHGNVHGAKA